MKAFGLVQTFLPLSFFTIGGGQAILAEVQRQVVTNHHWMTRKEFANAFALSRVAPGPGALYITLIGWHVAGLLGATVTTLAIFGPTALTTYLVAGFWSRHQDKTWRKCLEAGLKPLAAGMVMAGVYVLVTTLSGWLAYGVALASGITLIVSSRAHPVFVLLGGAGIFLLVQNI